jgi:hypothetical protein
LASNWNIDETPYPGPKVEPITLFIDPENSGWKIDTIGESTWFSATVTALPSSSDIPSLINTWVEFRNEGWLIYEGYLNGIEFETMFFGGKAKINITASSKMVQIDVNYA